MYKIAVMGDRDSIYGFASIGFTPFPITDVEDAKTILKKLAESEYRIIYITEKLASGINKEVEYYSKNGKVAIILIPGVNGNTGIGINAVKNSVIKAVGSDIIFGSES